MLRRSLLVATLISVFVTTTGCGSDDDDGETSQPSASAIVTATQTTSSTPGYTPLPEDRITFYAADPGDQAGAVISGDFNGDDAPDVILGAALGDGPGNDRTDAGEAYLFLGPFAPGASLDAADEEYDAIFYGAATGDQFSRGLAAGDFNGDGLDDIAFAAPQANAFAGAVYVMFGAREWPLETDFAQTDPDVSLQGADEGDYAGLALYAGSLDEDMSDDLVIGALLSDGPGNERLDSGEAYVVPGAEMPAGATISLSAWERVVYGAATNDRLGEALGVGNVDEDPLDELLLVAPFANEGAGETYVIDGVPAAPVDLAEAVPPRTIPGLDPGDQLGHSIGIGDVDGDGIGDVWLGAVSADGPENSVDLAGEAILVRSAGQTIVYGPQTEARLGRSLAVADVSGDGLADLIIAAPNLLDRAGVVFVYFGTTGEPVVSFALRGLDEGDILGHESFGVPPMGAADVDGDGRLDILVSAPAGDGPNNDRTDAGEAYLVPVSRGG